MSYKSIARIDLYDLSCTNLPSAFEMQKRPNGERQTVKQHSMLYYCMVPELKQAFAHGMMINQDLLLAFLEKHTTRYNEVFVFLYFLVFSGLYTR